MENNEKKYFIRACVLHKTEGWCETLFDGPKVDTQEEAIKYWADSELNYDYLYTLLDNSEFIEINLMERDKDIDCSIEVLSNL